MIRHLVAIATILGTASLPAQAAWLTEAPVDPATSPSMVRDGQSIPLRPEMLPAVPVETRIPIVTPEVLPNGMRFFFLEARGLPRVDLTVMVAGGNQIDPPGKAGLSALTAEGMQAGGAGNLAPEAFDQELEQIGSTIGVESARESLNVGLFALKTQADRAFSLAADLIQRPRFDAKQVERQRELMLEGIRRQDDDPAGMARRLFYEMMYGSTHPRGRFATTVSVAAISRQDIVEFHKRWVHPNAIWIGVTGDLSRDEARALVMKHFGSWSSKAPALPVMPKAPSDEQSTGVTIVSKPTQQTQIRIGHLGIPRRHPDRYAVTLLNNVYGSGGFSSRLMDRVRTRQGFAYGVSGALQSDNPVGLFQTAGATKAKTTAAAIREMLAVLKETASGDVTEQELDTARRDAIFSFLNDFQTPNQSLSRSMNADFTGEAPDFLEKFVERLRGVTLEQVNQAARTHFHPDRLRILVVGFEKAFDKPLEEFGAVTRTTSSNFTGSLPKVPLPEARY